MRQSRIGNLLDKAQVPLGRGLAEALAELDEQQKGQVIVSRAKGLYDDSLEVAPGASKSGHKGGSGEHGFDASCRFKQRPS